MLDVRKKSESWTPKCESPSKLVPNDKNSFYTQLSQKVMTIMYNPYPAS
jgi:hypothetical protein